MGYRVTLVYIWLSSPDQAQERVATRVAHGGHHIPDDVIQRRYYKGLSNLMHLFIPIVDYWIIGDNSLGKLTAVASGVRDIELDIKNADIWNIIKTQSL